jgi:hypothetical protein
MFKNEDLMLAVVSGLLAWILTLSVKIALGG